MSNHLSAWQCIGCGKLEAPQNCVGVCQDRRVELVYAGEYEAVCAELAVVRGERDALAREVERLTGIAPKLTASPAAGPAPSAAATASGPSAAKPRLRRPATLVVR